MKYNTDSRGNALREGLYRDKDDRLYFLYLHKKRGMWKCQISTFIGEFDFPLHLSKSLEPADERDVRRIIESGMFLEKILIRSKK